MKKVNFVLSLGGVVSGIVCFVANRASHNYPAMWGFGSATGWALNALLDSIRQ